MISAHPINVSPVDGNRWGNAPATAVPSWGERVSLLVEPAARSAAPWT
jgi:hypothetical protein